jgi:hypothetical protein
LPSTCTFAPGKYTGRVRIGKHTFVASKEGFTTRIRAPFIEPGQNFRIELKLYTAEELTRYKRRWDNRYLPYEVIAGGLVFIGVGGVFEALASSSYKKYDDTVAACSQGMTGCSELATLNSLRRRGDAEKTVGLVGYGIGAAAIATGAALWYLNRPQPYTIRAEDLNDERDAQVTPIVTPTFAGAAVRGSF